MRILIKIPIALSHQQLERRSRLKFRYRSEIRSISADTREFKTQEKCLVLKRIPISTSIRMSMSGVANQTLLVPDSSPKWIRVQLVESVARPSVSLEMNANTMNYYVGLKVNKDVSINFLNMHPTVAGDTSGLRWTPLASPQSTSSHRKHQPSAARFHCRTSNPNQKANLNVSYKANYNARPQMGNRNIRTRMDQPSI